MLRLFFLAIGPWPLALFVEYERRSRLALIRSNQELKEANRKLRQLQDDLVHAGRLSAMGAMSAGIVHEVSQPLASLDVYVQLARTAGDAATVADSLEVIEGQLARVNEIVSGLRDFSRKPTSTRAPVDVNSCIEEVLRLVSAQLEQDDIRLSAALDPAKPLVEGDAGQLGQVFLNLVSNARDALREKADGPRGLRVASDTRDGQVVVSVQDDGPGVSPQEADHLFEPFFTTKQEKGLGLGLSISKRIVEDHGGAIEMESAPGQGTIFKVRLPMTGAATG
jgi:C4-dicarboxylate-specific signal transduction histidine kinase